MTRDRDAYEEGLRAGYAHGYDIGFAHGRAQTEIEHVEVSAKLDGPTRAELIARGHIPRDLTRPPALPVRLWDTSDWAKADLRDLPTTEHGHTQWRQALTAGRVPAHLADAYVQAHPDRASGLAARVTREVADAGRAVAEVHHRLEQARPVPPARHRDEPTDLTRPADLERGIGR